MKTIRPFKGGATSTKGGRDYVHGSDILPEIEALCEDQNGMVCDITFSTPLTTSGALHLLTEKPDQTENIHAFGRLHLDNVPAWFSVHAGQELAGASRHYDEDAIPVTGDIETGFDVSILPENTTMEHVLKGVKVAASKASGVDRKWWFARLTDKTSKIPNILEVRDIHIMPLKNIAGRMIQCLVRINGDDFCKIEFVGTNK